MSDRDVSPPNMIDLGPALRRKRTSQCRHPSADVDLTAASLTCTECEAEAELDPWWYLRKLATESDEEAEARDKARAEHAVWCEQANAQARKLHGELTELYATKNRLANERVNDATLGTITAKSRRRRTSAKT